jgi:hypothetical protein
MSERRAAVELDEHRDARRAAGSLDPDEVQRPCRDSFSLLAHIVSPARFVLIGTGAEP